MRSPCSFAVATLLALVAVAESLVAQSSKWNFAASNIVVPQCRSYAVATAVQVVRVDVRASVVERLAVTTLEMTLLNPSASRLEAQLLIPVPDNSVVHGFDFNGKGNSPNARLLPRLEAEAIYRSLVTQIRDPALLEFAGNAFLQTNVFPVEPGMPQKVRIEYEHLLVGDADRIDFVVPRSESLDYRVPWSIEVQVQSKAPIATLYSPSHAIETVWHSVPAMGATTSSKITAANSATVRIAESSKLQPGPFRLSILAKRQAMTASLLAAPDPKTGGGYFLLLAAAPKVGDSAAHPRQKREVTLVIDRSGSMHGEKIEQVREACLQVVAGLQQGESFNVIDYQTGVDRFAPQPVAKSPATELAARAYIKALQPGGGTNIHEALKAALEAPPAAGTLPLVLFLTDGLPTVGQTSEVAIRDLLRTSNPHRRRVFTFGVGVDVNSPLLEAVAVESRATSSFILPRENVEVKVAEIFKRLSGPLLTDPVLHFTNEDGSPALGRVLDIMPERMPDLFDGDQLVVLGRYIGTGPLHFKLRGSFLGSPREFTYRFDFANASSTNAFVPRLWASRRIAQLVGAIRRLGADSSTSSAAAPVLSADPRFKELVDEIVRLSTEFGVLTEYTAFFAQEGTDLSRRHDVVRSAAELLDKRAGQCRSGWASVNQSLNYNAQLWQKELKPRNGFIDHEMKSVEISNVQQMHDRCFYRKGNRWIDSTVIARETQPSRTIAFGGDEFFALVRKLASQGRAGAVTLKGDIVLEVDGATVLITAPKP